MRDAEAAVLIDHQCGHGGHQRCHKVDQPGLRTVGNFLVPIQRDDSVKERNDTDNCVKPTEWNNLWQGKSPDTCFS